jgi:hypothetical protein
MKNLERDLHLPTKFEFYIGAVESGDFFEIQLQNDALLSSSGDDGESDRQIKTHSTTAFASACRWWLRSREPSARGKKGKRNERMNSPDKGSLAAGLKAVSDEKLLRVMRQSNKLRNRPWAAENSKRPCQTFSHMRQKSGMGILCNVRVKLP